MKILSPIKSLYLLISLISSLLYFFTILIFKIIWQNKITKRYSKQEITQNISTKWAKFFFNSIPSWSIKLTNKLSKHKTQQTYIIVANHESSTDILVLYFLGIRLSWLAKAELFKFPIIGTAMKWAGSIPVQRNNKISRANSLKLCTQTLDHNSIIFFPEGTRSTSGKIKDFRMGAFSLSQKTNTPILPVVIKGSSTSLKKGSLAFNKSTIHIKVLSPTNPQKDEDSKQYCTRVRNIMKEEHERL